METAGAEATEPRERVHVTPFIYEHPKRFRLLSVTGDDDWSHLRWTVDAAEDLGLVRRIYRSFGGRDDFGWREPRALFEADPSLAEINRQVRQKSLEEL